MLFNKIRNKVDKLKQNFKSKKNPLSIRGNIELSDKQFKISEKAFKPRVIHKGIEYSSYYQIEIDRLPKSVIALIVKYWSRIEKSLGDEGVLRSATLYRIIHVPKEIRNTEIFSDAWHRDTIGVTNAQIFILLHDTNEKNGSMRYIKSESMKDVTKKYPSLKNPDKRSVDFNINNKYVSYFNGKRGDYLILNTYCNFHSATNPYKGYKRDMISIAFEPKKSTKWPKVYDFNSLQKLL